MATTRVSAEQSKKASETLGLLDKAASSIQKNFAAWGLSKAAAKDLVNHLDKVADDLEVGVFGPESIAVRQVEVLKSAKVLQKDSDEAYMSAFEVDQGVIQSESDEPYMDAYADDQSSAVRDGKSTTGRPLAP